ncbi:MAG: hypothetical protein II869_08260, partial [Synergistaceae bacterium]|nr:hypothetical protein [Synergistaceae bacterium]
GWKFVLTFREGRSPDAYEMACDSMEVSISVRGGSRGTLGRSADDHGSVSNKPGSPDGTFADERCS